MTGAKQKHWEKPTPHARSTAFPRPPARARDAVNIALV